MVHPNLQTLVARISRMCVRARSTKKSGYLQSALRNPPSRLPLTFQYLNRSTSRYGNIHYYNSNCIGSPWTVSFIVLNFFVKPLLLRRRISNVSQLNRILFCFQNVNETPFLEAPERVETKRYWNSSVPRNLDITLILVTVRNTMFACLAVLCSNPAQGD